MSKKYTIKPLDWKISEAGDLEADAPGFRYEIRAFRNHWHWRSTEQGMDGWDDCDSPQHGKKLAQAAHEEALEQWFSSEK